MERNLRWRTVALCLIANTAALTPAGPAWSQPSSDEQAPPAFQSPSPIAERYQLADRLLRPGQDGLVVDANLGAVFTANGAGLLYRTGAAGARALTYYDLATGARRVLADERALAAALQARIGEPVDPTTLTLADAYYSPEASTLSFTDRGRRWLYRDEGTLDEAERGPPEGEGAISPDGRFEILARDYNLFARDRRSGREVALTTDGTREQPYGRGIPLLGEMVRQGTEEPVMPPSVRWSPDSRSIATWRLDTRGVHRLSMTQASPPGSRYPRSYSYVYPLAGAETLPQATRYAVDVEGALRRRRATLVPLDIPSESILYPADPDIGWLGDQVRAQWTERGYRQLVVYAADPRTGRSTIRSREAVAPQVTVTSSWILPAEELGGELHVSERTGWAQLYLVTPDAPDGGRALTQGPWEITGVGHVDAERRRILAIGVGREGDRNPYYRALYAVPVDGGEPVLLTPEPLDHDVTLSPDGRWFIDSMSSPTAPTVTLLRSTEDGRIVATLARADASRLFAAGYLPPETFQGVAADGVTPLWSTIWKPAGFDPRRRYPVIDQVYTGPTTTNVPVTWSQTIAHWAGSVAQIGVVVVAIDGRGTSRRGQAFRLHSYQNLGEVGLDDHIGMIRQIAGRHPNIDLDRVGVFGGSAGGYDAARFVLRRPEFFKVAVAWAGNHDLRLDKTWWPEVSMGNPAPEVWERNSNMSVAGNLRGKLLLLHGDIDDNVPMVASIRLADAIIEAGRDVDLVVLPNTGHAMRHAPFFWRKLRDYFARHLLDEAPPPLPLPPPPAPTPAPTESPVDPEPALVPVS